MQGRELSQLQGILGLKFSYACRRKGETLTIQELSRNPDKIWGWVTALRNDAFADRI